MNLLWNIRESLSCDLRSLAFTRIYVALVMLRVQGDLLLHPTVWLGATGIMSRESLMSLDKETFSIYYADSSMQWSLLLLGLHFVINFLFLIGYKTKLMTILNAFMAGQIAVVTHPILIGGDRILLFCMIWLSFMPLGARFSVDRMLEKMEEGGQSDKVKENEQETKYDTAHFGAGSVAMTTNFIAMYFCSGVLKYAPEWTEYGTAVAIVMHHNLYTQPQAQWVYKNFAPLLKLATFGTYYIEVWCPFIMMSPIFFNFFRVFCLLMFVQLQLGFVALMRLGWFPFVSILAQLPLTPGCVWRWLERKTRSKARVGTKIVFQKQNAYARYVCAVFDTFFLHVDTKVETCTDQSVLKGSLWAVQLSDKSYVTDEKAAISEVMKVSWLPMRIFSCVFLPVFNMYAPAKEDKTTTLSAPPLKTYHGYKGVRGIASWLIALPLLFVVVVVNASGFIPPQVHPDNADGVYRNKHQQRTFVYAEQFMDTFVGGYKGPIMAFASKYHLYQNWGLFAPRPDIHDGWVHIEGILTDGRTQDISHSLLQGDWQNFAEVSDKFAVKESFYIYPSFKWRAWAGRMSTQGGKNLACGGAEYFCNSWNENHYGDDRLDNVTISYMLQRTMANLDTIYEDDVDEFRVWTHYCKPSYNPHATATAESKGMTGLETGGFQWSSGGRMTDCKAADFKEQGPPPGFYESIAGPRDACDDITAPGKCCPDLFREIDSQVCSGFSQACYDFECDEPMADCKPDPCYNCGVRGYRKDGSQIPAEKCRYTKLRCFQPGVDPPTCPKEEPVCELHDCPSSVAATLMCRYDPCTCKPTWYDGRNNSPSECGRRKPSGWMEIKKQQAQGGPPGQGMPPGGGAGMMPGGGAGMMPQGGNSMGGGMMPGGAGSGMMPKKKKQQRSPVNL